MNDVRHAYATLGLSEGSSFAVVRRRYRALVKTWHPDRFASDPQGQSEASLRMRAINSAYTRLVRHFESMKPSSVPEKMKASFSEQRRLTREEIDAMVAAINSEGPVDSFLGAVGWVGSTFEGVVTALVASAFLVRLVTIVLRSEWWALLDPEILLGLCIIGVLGFKEYFHRQKLRAIGRELTDASSS